MAVLESQGIQIFWTGTAAFSTDSTLATGNLIDFDGPTGVAAKIDITDLDSTGKEYIMAVRDEGEISLSVNYDKSNLVQSVMFQNRGTRTRKNWIIDGD